MIIDLVDPRLPACPNVAKLTSHIAYPSIFFVFVLLAILALFYALITYFKFNTVKVFKRVIHRDEISNSYWILFYILSTIKCSLLAAKYATGFAEHQMMIQLFSLAVSIGHAFCAFTLSLALLHQWRCRSQSRDAIDRQGAEIYDSINSSSSSSSGTPRPISPSDTLNGRMVQQGNFDLESSLGPIHMPRDYRSPPPPIASSVYVSETTPFFGSNEKFTTSQWLMRFVISWEMCFFLLMTLYVILIFVLTTDIDHPLYYVVIAAYCLQRLPIVVFSGIICLSGITTSFDIDSSEGPSIGSRAAFALGMIFNLMVEIPVSAWSRALGSYGCILHFASGVDIIFSCAALAYTLFFVFLTREFSRNVEACLWGTALRAVR